MNSSNIVSLNLSGSKLFVKWLMTASKITAPTPKRIHNNPCIFFDFSKSKRGSSRWLIRTIFCPIYISARFEYYRYTVYSVLYINISKRHHIILLPSTAHTLQRCILFAFNINIIVIGWSYFPTTPWQVIRVRVNRYGCCCSVTVSLRRSTATHLLYEWVCVRMSV